MRKIAKTLSGALVITAILLCIRAFPRSRRRRRRHPRPESFRQATPSERQGVASASSSIVAALSKGSYVTLISKSGNW
jgi:hypothetical protein